MADRMPVLLAVAYVGALAWIVYEWQPAPPMADALPVEQTMDLAPLRLPDVSIWELEAFEEIVARPPFTPGRRPVETAGDGDGAPAKASPDNGRQSLATMRVSAILNDNEQMTALIEKGDGGAFTLREGGKLEGWRVNEIRDDRIVLALGGRHREMLVYRFEPVPDAREARRPADGRRRPERPPLTPRRAAPRAAIHTPPDGPRR